MKLKSRLVPAGLIALVIVACSYLASTHATLNDDSGDVPAPIGATKKGATTEELPAPKLDAVKIAPTSPAQNGTFKRLSDGHFLTSATQVTIGVEITASADDGSAALYVNGVPQKNQSIKNSGQRTFEFVSVNVQERENTISVEWKPTTGGFAGRSFASDTLFITRDTVGPTFQHAEVIDVPATGTTLVVTFADDDFDKTTLTEAFKVVREDKGGGFAAQDTMSIQGAPVISGRTIRLSFAALSAGQYQLMVQGDKLKDIVGNFAGGNSSAGAAKPWVFAVLAGRKSGEHIEFPPYAPPTKQAIPIEGFNPADYVTTRVARLYYYRDAHRVAEIINRNVRSYNQAAVTQAERRASKARDDADDAADNRRKTEREAVQAAQQSRNAEQKLAATQEVLGVVRQLEFEIGDKTARVEEIKQKLAEVRSADENARGLKEAAAAATLTAREARAEANRLALERANAEIDDEATKNASAQARLKAENDEAEAMAARTRADSSRGASNFVALDTEANRLRDIAVISRADAV